MKTAAVLLGGRKKQPATAQLLLDAAGAAMSGRKQPPMHQQNTVMHVAPHSHAFGKRGMTCVFFCLVLDK